MKKLILFGSLVALSIGCSSAEDEAASTAADTSKIASLPAATGPVVSSSSLTQSVDAFAATTGIKLSTMGSSTDWTPRSDW